MKTQLDESLAGSVLVDAEEQDRPGQPSQTASENEVPRQFLAPRAEVLSKILENILHRSPRTSGWGLNE